MMRLLQVAISICFLMLCANARAEVKLPAIFGEHMVVQRGMPLPIWGMAKPGEKVTVQFGVQQLSTTADAQGRWRIKLSAVDSNEPMEMTVAGSNTIVLRDVLVGDVWLCAGQSNMSWPVRASLDAPREVAEARFPEIRLFKVARKASAEPQEEISGTWVVCSPQTVGDFSGVAYFFGRELHRTLKCPIGLIDDSWNAPAESWVDAATLRRDPKLLPILTGYETTLARLPEAQKEYQAKLASWREATSQTDPGMAASARDWSKPDFDDNSWQTIKAPGRWEEAAKLVIDGAIWFRKEVIVSDSWSGKELVVNLGGIDDYDATYINGQRVGGLGREITNPRWIQRSYAIPASLIKPGRNIIAIRIFDQGGAGGMIGPAENLNLALKDNSAPPISLTGTWKYAIELRLEPKSNLSMPPSEPIGPNTAGAPANAYNGMIHPLIPLAIKGAAWYHGESEVGKAAQYKAILPAMIGGWRTAWGQGDFPFLITQLPNFRAPVTDAGTTSQWAELRDAQLWATRTVPNSALAVTIDLGDERDIHPRNKQDVGRRLALAAEQLAYRLDVAGRGPMFKEIKIAGNQIIISFEKSNCGLTAKGGQLNGFAIAGTDRKFFAADAKIEDNKVIVFSETVPHPVAVRYGWADNPQATLYNAEGLPASPFRSDDWQDTPMTQH